jgi:hypothetical protein
MTGRASGLARLYVAFDDTDNAGADRGTGKIGRWFEDQLPAGCTLWGVVRQQLLVHPDVPYTSHNSSAVCVVDVCDPALVVTLADDVARPWACGPSPELVDDLVARGAEHLARHRLAGSDPGLCVAWEGSAAIAALGDLGRRAAIEVVSQEDAYAAASGVHLSGHGGTEDGVIGAAAGAGLTAGGWHGRLIEYVSELGHLRDIPEPVKIAQLAIAGVTVVTLDRDAPAPLPDAPVHAGGWLRPRLWAARPVLPVQRDGDGGWLAVGPRTTGEGAGASDDVDAVASS